MRILHIQLDTSMGGIESFLFNVYKKIDREKVQFDFIEYGFESRSFDHYFEELGANIFKLPNRLKNPIKANALLLKLLEEKKYKIVHIHKNSLCDVSAIKICSKFGVPTIIIHSHNCSRDNKIIKILHKLNLKFFDLNPYIKFSCSEKASAWLFGKHDNSITIINNGVDLEKFKYSLDIREKIRKELCVEQFFVLGSVGRLSEQKNPFFLIKIMNQLMEKHPQIKLLWVGDGELRQAAEKLSNELGVTKNIIFVGNVDNVQDYYQAMDLFVMPSLYEGFPIAAVEAQCSGLPCILSNSITREVKIIPNVEFISLEMGENTWIESILLKIDRQKERESQINLIKNSGYDIQITADYLQDFYIKNKN